MTTKEAPFFACENSIENLSSCVYRVHFKENHFVLAPISQGYSAVLPFRLEAFLVDVPISF